MAPITRQLVQELDALGLAGQRRRKAIIFVVDARRCDRRGALAVAAQQARDAARVLLRRALLVVALRLDLAPGDLGGAYGVQ